MKSKLFPLATALIFSSCAKLPFSKIHKIYSSNKDSEISLVEIPIPILNNNFSYVHKEISFERHNATKSSSLVCFPNNYFALGKNSLYFSNETKDILLNISVDNVLNSSSEIFDLDNISPLLLKNSCLSFNGANKCNFLLNISSNIFPCDIKILNKTLASNTTSIYINPSFFNCKCIDDLTLFANSSASSSVNLDLETISLATENSNSFTKDSITLAKANLNLSLNSEGISTLTVISSMNLHNNNEYLNLSDFVLQPIKQVYPDIFLNS